jgi:hypothetical protein
MEIVIRRNEAYNMLKITSIYIGVLMGNFLMHFILNWSKYLEGVYIPPIIRFLFIGVLLVIQITVFIMLMFFFAKKFYLEILRSPYNNFFIGFLFSVFYILFSIVFASRVDLLNNNWFIYLIVPMIVFFTLIYFNYLIFSWKVLK